MLQIDASIVSYKFETVCNKCLVSGHSYLPYDSDFWDVGKYAKSHPHVYIYSSHEWYEIVRKARSKHHNGN